MSCIDFNNPLPSPKVEQDTNLEQNFPLTIGCDFNIERLANKSQQPQNFSSTVPSNLKMQSGNEQSSNIRLISKFLMVFRKKKQGMTQNRRRYSHFQKIYEEKLFHSELKLTSQVKSRFLFDPNHFSYLIWQQLKLFYILFLLLFVTFYWSFDDLERVVSDQASVSYILLIIDIIAQSNVSIIIKGKIINNRLTILNRYLRGTFIENLVFLISYFVLVKTNHEIASIVFYITGIKIFYQIINRLQDFYDFDFISSEIVKLIKLIVFINLLAHFIACLWHYVGQVSDVENNWLDQIGIRNAEKNVRYIYSFYWSVTTMVTVGYGDITPMNSQEVTVCVLVILISCGVFAFSLNLIGQVLQTYNQYQDKLNNSFRTLNNYFKQHNISEQLQSRSKNYLQYVIREREKESLNDVLNKLPSKLRQEIIEEAFVKMLPKIPILHDNFSATSLNKASHFLQIECYLPGDYVINQSSLVKNDQALYFIEQGQVQVFEQQSKTVLYDIPSGQAFGLYEFFTDSQAKYSLICKSEARIFKLARSDFINLLSKDDFESFHQIKHCYQFNVPLKNLNCQFCNTSDHLTENCKLFFFSRDISHLFFEKENLKQGRAPYDRKYYRFQSMLHQNRTLKVQCKYMENYIQEISNEQIEDVDNISKAIQSNFNSVVDIYKPSEKQVPLDSEKSVISKNCPTPVQKAMKSDPKLKANENDKAINIQERLIVFEIDKIKNFNKYFSDENYENQIQKYNKLQPKRNRLQSMKQKLRAMKFIQKI